MANINNYINAAAASLNSASEIERTLADNKIRFADMGAEQVSASAADAVQAISSNADVQNAKTNAAAVKEGAEILNSRDESIEQSRGTIRKAGLLAAGANSLAMANYLSNKKDQPNDMLTYMNDQRSALNTRILENEANILKRQQELAAFGKVNNSTKSTDAESIDKSDSQAIGTQLNLTDNDFKELAYAVSSEAALGTNDEFGVAANIITRLKNGGYGSSVAEIIRAPGQYQGVYQGKSSYSPEIQQRLQSPEGQAKIQDYIKQLDGRTEFKGQSMLGNRVKAEDPMFDPAGNFYHYSWQ